MLEDKDIQKLKKELATKDDLEKFATKKDLTKQKDEILSETDKKLAKQKDEIISKAMEAFPIKAEVVSQEDFEELKDSFSELQSSVDSYTKKADDYFQEMLMLSRKVDRHEQWLHEIANKLNIKLDY